MCRRKRQHIDQLLFLPLPIEAVGFDGAPLLQAVLLGGLFYGAAISMKKQPRKRLLFC